jgi:predicted RNase H-like nuclease (RuvC/YqgF family)
MDLHGIKIPEVIAGSFMSAPVFWLYFKRIMLKSAQDTTETKSAEAKTDVIELLRSEVERLSAINSKLSESLNELQQESVKLQQENIKLRQEILDLRSTVNDLVRRENHSLANDLVKQQTTSHSHRRKQ